MIYTLVQMMFVRSSTNIPYLILIIFDAHHWEFIYDWLKLEKKL